MRNEQEMLDLILNTASCDDRIRAVMMNGSRVNPNARRDIFQDYDIIYYVTEIASFLDDPAWIDCFGERMILQLPDLMQDPPPDNDSGSFAYLIQLMDGNRIDLTLMQLDHAQNAAEHDSLSRVLLDKDGLLPPLPPPSEHDYLPQPPTVKAYFDCCNEFWWVCPYVAKGLWREEITYAKHSMEHYVRDQLMKMLVWYIGVETDFSVSPGKSGKYFKRYLPPELWAMLEQTYADASYERTWDALFVMGDLFRITAQHVAEKMGFEYLHQDDERVSAHLRHVFALPKDAPEMY